MPKLMHAVFAERVVVDRFTNELHVIGLIEQLGAQEPSPDVMARALKEKKGIAGSGRVMLLIHWRRSDPAKPEGKQTARIQIIGPHGKVLATAVQEFALREYVYMRNVLPLDKLPIVGPGTYTAKVAVQRGKSWKRAGETSFELVFQKRIAEGAKVRVH